MTNEFKPDRASTPHGVEEEKSHAYWVRFWENAVVRVDGKEVKNGDPVALFRTEQSKFLSNDLREEADLLVDGNVIPPSGMDFLGRHTYTITLDYKNLKLLQGIPLGMDITSAELDPDSFNIDPARLVASEAHQWTFIPPTQRNGSFKIKLLNEENTAELLTPTNRLTVPKHKMRFFHILGGGHTYMSTPPEEYKLIPGVFMAMVDILGTGGVPVANTSVTFICPPLPDATVKTNEKGIALTPLIFGAARYKITAIAKVDSEEYRTELLINASV